MFISCNKSGSVYPKKRKETRVGQKFIFYDPSINFFILMGVEVGTTYHKLLHKVFLLCFIVKPTFFFFFQFSRGRGLHLRKPSYTQENNYNGRATCTRNLIQKSKCTQSRPLLKLNNNHFVIWKYLIEVEQ